MKPQDIINFIFFPVVNEGCRVVKEKIVDKASDLDVASVLAMGFPAARGGLIFWGDFVGAEKICSELEKFASALPSMAGFFKPCDYLKQCAATGSKLENGPGAVARL
jgi:enoyl-CoA hydratase/3-hydroxyacyl-CoA dehydrogenase